MIAFIFAITCIFAQTVSITNTVKTEPAIRVDGGVAYFGYKNDVALRDEVVGEAITADGRARVIGRVRFDLQSTDPNRVGILSVKPRWSWGSSAATIG